MDPSLREVALIVVVAAAGAGFIYLETRDRAILVAAAVMLPVIALGILVVGSIVSVVN